MKQYDLGKLCIDADGVIWVYWHGTHADQGGMSFGYGSAGASDAEPLLAIVGRNIDQNKDKYLERIRKREKNDDTI